MIDVVAGTAEDTWLAWDGLAALPTSDLLGRPPGTAIVVAPHPDDEVLGAGGTLRLLHRRGWALHVVAVTDGEGSHPGSRVHSAGELRAIRSREAAAARRSLGLRRCAVDRLALADGEVAAHEDRLEDHLRRLGPADLVLAPWRHDGHPDHDACGRAAGRAAAVNGIPLVEYLVWMWNWAGPDDGRVPWDRARRVDLPAGDRRRKGSAIDLFASQVRPIGPEPADAAVLPARVLAHHRRPFEVLLA